MKKITLVSFVFMALLVTGVSALIVNNGSENLANKTEEKNSDKAKDDFTKAEEALSELEDAAGSDGSNGSNGSNGSVCKAYAKVQRYCTRVDEYDDDSSDKDDDSSDDQSDDNVSDYQSKVQNILNRADEVMKKAQERTKELNCEKEIECQEMKNKFLYNLSGDDDSSRIKYEAGCGENDEHDDHDEN